MSSTIRLCLSLLLAAAGIPRALAQPPCDSLDVVGFSHTGLGAYTYSFTPNAPGASSMLGTEWAFLGTDHLDFSLAAMPQTTFPGTGDYLVCLRTTLVNDQSGICRSVHCELLPVPVDSACANVVADFTISLEGGSIAFSDLSSSLQPFVAYAWDLGDGSTSTEPSPTHTYAGAGPYEACLTVTTATCSATVCNWIYLGAPNVPCGTLLQPAIGMIQYEHFIAVFDESITSGMNSTIHWDFGDGTTASGDPVVHAYAWPGLFEVCGEVRLWGPLTPDTCLATSCELVYTHAATGIGTHGEDELLQAFPLPFADVLTVSGTPAGAAWQLVDLLGRPCLAGIAPMNGPLTIRGEALAPGTYVLQLRGPSRGTSLRVVKQAAGP